MTNLRDYAFEDLVDSYGPFDRERVFNSVAHLFCNDDDLYMALMMETPFYEKVIEDIDVIHSVLQTGNIEDTIVEMIQEHELDDAFCMKLKKAIDKRYKSNE